MDCDVSLLMVTKTSRLSVIWRLWAIARPWNARHPRKPVERTESGSPRSMSCEDTEVPPLFAINCFKVLCNNAVQSNGRLAA
jgi:hypothetical protein